MEGFQKRKTFRMNDRFQGKKHMREALLRI